MNHLRSLVRDSARYLSPLVLFVGGVWLLSLRIPFWSLFLGIAATQVGIVLLILSFDNSEKSVFGQDRFHIIQCEVCGDPMAVLQQYTTGICATCRKKASS